MVERFKSKDIWVNRHISNDFDQWEQVDDIFPDENGVQD
jgi:hypothetical protein